MRIRPSFALLALVAALGTHGQSQGALFVTGTPVVVGTGPGEVVLADLNQDGHLDIVTRHLLQRRVAVMLGDGKGGFTAAPGSPMTLPYQP